MKTSEDLCRQCGQCCQEKLVIDGEVYLTSVPCEHLDARTRRCRVYGLRHETNRRCLSIPDAIAARALPVDCPYVRDLPGYRPPLPAGTLPGLERLVLRARKEKAKEMKQMKRMAGARHD